MWEQRDPRDQASFEEDVIANTDENLYQRPLFCRHSKGGFGGLVESAGGPRTSLLFSVDEFGENEISQSLFQRDAQDNDFELDLEMTDLLDELEPA